MLLSIRRVLRRANTTLPQSRTEPKPVTQPKCADVRLEGTLQVRELELSASRCAGLRPLHQRAEHGQIEPIPARAIDDHVRHPAVKRRDDRRTKRSMIRDVKDLHQLDPAAFGFRS